MKNFDYQVSSRSKPTQRQLAELDVLVVEFVAHCRETGREFLFGGTPQSAFTFSLFFEEPGRMCINQVRLHSAWEGHGVFARLVQHLKGQPHFKGIGIKSVSVGAARMRQRAVEHGFKEYGDGDFLFPPR